MLGHDPGVDGNAGRQQRQREQPLPTFIFLQLLTWRLLEKAQQHVVGGARGKGIGLVDHQVSEAVLGTCTQVLNTHISQGTPILAGLPHLCE